MTGSPEQKSNRKTFLNQIFFGWIGLTILPALYVIANYLVPPRIRDRVATTLDVGKIDDIPAGGAKIVRVNKKAVILVRSQKDQVKAFSAVCTHLGCIVEYRAEEKDFHCNCHGSVFDINGKNIGGPAPRPLRPYRVTLSGSEITVSDVS